MPAIAPKFLTAKESSGVGRSSSNTYVLMPKAHSVSAVASVNRRPLLRLSCAITTPRRIASLPRLTIKLPNPFVACRSSDSYRLP